MQVQNHARRILEPRRPNTFIISQQRLTFAQDTLCMKLISVCHF